MNSTERPDSTSLWPMAHIAWVLPVPGIPNARTLTPRSTKSPSPSLPSCCLSCTGVLSCSKVSQVLPAGSFDALLRRSTRLIRLIRLSSASCSITSKRVTRASACPASLEPPDGLRRQCGQLEPPAQLPDTFRHRARCVRVHDHRTPPPSSRSYTPRSTVPCSFSSGTVGGAGADSLHTIA